MIWAVDRESILNALRDENALSKVLPGTVATLRLEAAVAVPSVAFSWLVVFITK